MHGVLAFFLALGLASTAAAEVEALTPDEARTALQRARWPQRAPGFYRKVETTERRAGVTMRTTWEWVREDGVRLQRIERTTKRRSGGEVTQITIVDERGRWMLHDAAAILHSLTGMRQEMEARLAGRKAELEQLDPEERRKWIESRASVTGERVRNEHGTRLHLTQVFGKQAREMMRELAEDMVADARKQIPLLLRPVVAAALAAKGGITAQLPVRREMVVDEPTGLIVSVRQFAADGREIASRKGEERWERCDPVPLERFVVPETLPRLEARTLGELLELERKYERADRAAKKQRTDAGPGTD